jgi:hypothetical protein
MTAHLEKVNPAKHKYNHVRFSHIKIKPGQPAVLTADPWSFLHGTLLRCIDERKGANRKRYIRANYYASLAENFYRAALATDLPAKGTLLYYGMLNLTKCLLSVERIPLETTKEYHGIRLSFGTQFRIEVENPRGNSISIFAEFAKLLGTPVEQKREVELRDAFSHIPELHSVCFGLNFLSRRKFLPITIEFLVDERKDYLFTEITFDKKHEQPLSTKRFLRGERANYFMKGYPREGKIVYRSKRRKRLGTWDRVYSNVLKEYSRFDITSMLTRAGYNYYCDLAPGQYHHLCYSLLVLFYIGSTARYRPTEVEKLMSGEFRPLVTETAALVPKQFLYQIVSRVTRKLCVMPFADI